MNQPMQPDDEPLVDPEDWKAVESLDLPPRAGMCFLGYAASAKPEPLERGRRDGCGTLYVDAAEAGFLQLCGGMAVERSGGTRLAIRGLRSGTGTSPSDAVSECVIVCGLRAMAAARKSPARGPGFRVV